MSKRLQTYETPDRLTSIQMSVPIPAAVCGACQLSSTSNASAGFSWSSTTDDIVAQVARCQRGASGDAA
jgi:hypothetical protein